jgi:hypothetical protein
LFAISFFFFHKKRSLSSEQVIETRLRKEEEEPATPGMILPIVGIPFWVPTNGIPGAAQLVAHVKVTKPK